MHQLSPDGTLTDELAAWSTLKIERLEQTHYGRVFGEWDEWDAFVTSRTRPGTLRMYLTSDVYDMLRDRVLCLALNDEGINTLLDASELDLACGARNTLYGK